MKTSQKEAKGKPLGTESWWHTAVFTLCMVT